MPGRGKRQSSWVGFVCAATSILLLDQCLYRGPARPPSFSPVPDPRAGLSAKPLVGHILSKAGTGSWERLPSRRSVGGDRAPRAVLGIMPGGPFHTPKHTLSQACCAHRAGPWDPVWGSGAGPAQGRGNDRGHEGAARERQQRRIQTRHLAALPSSRRYDFGKA